MIKYSVRPTLSLLALLPIYATHSIRFLNTVADWQDMRCRITVYNQNAQDKETLILDSQCPPGHPIELQLEKGKKYDLTFYNVYRLMSRGIVIVDHETEEPPAACLQTDQLTLTETDIKRIKKES